MERDVEATYLDEASGAEALKELERAGLDVDASRDEHEP
jgi:hypothetical protein